MSTPIDAEILDVGISYHMCRLNDMPFDAELVTNEAFHKNTVDPHELFFEVNTIKKVVEPEKLVKEIRAKHKPNNMLIFVQALTGKMTELELNDEYTVEEVKALIQEQEGWIPAVQRLLYSGRQMVDEKTLKDYQIADRSLIHLVLGLKGGGCIAYELQKDSFAPEWNYDFASHVNEGPQFSRGGHTYNLPLGSMRYALKVLGKYENDLWLGANVQRSNEHDSVYGEWPVAYHGTTDPRAAEIVKSGGLKLEFCVRGTGIYCSPNPAVALGYAQPYYYNGCNYKLIFQVRIDPTRREIAPNGYWIAKANDAIRPYGICVYRC